MEQERERAFEDVKSLAVDVGVELASKILSKEMDASAHKAAIKESLTSLEAAYKKAV
jgi:F0F1-type ATP synthase membrane subunit b/b'